MEGKVTLLGIFGIAFFIIGLITALKSDADDVDKGIGKFFVVIALVLFGCGCHSIHVWNENKEAEEKYTMVEEKANSGYDVYINGTPVEVSHITIREYPVDSIIIHDESKEVHIALTSSD